MTGEKSKRREIRGKKTKDRQTLRNEGKKERTRESRKMGERDGK